MSETKKTDSELVQLILSGNIEKFSMLVDRYERLIFSFLISHKCKLQEAEDIAQDSFVKAFRHLNTFDNTRKFSNWLLTITRNLFIDHCRKSKRTISATELTTDLLSVETDSSKTNQPSELIIRRENFRKVSEMILSLDEVIRVPFVMRIVDEKSYQEIADSLELPLQTVKNRIFKARKLLKDKRQKLHELP